MGVFGVLVAQGQQADDLARVPGGEGVDDLGVLLDRVQAGRVASAEGGGHETRGAELAVDPGQGGVPGQADQVAVEVVDGGEVAVDVGHPVPGAFAGGWLPAPCGLRGNPQK
nr:hypothetical protein [Rhizohabitans arisaemae]